MPLWSMLKLEAALRNISLVKGFRTPMGGCFRPLLDRLPR